MALFNRKSATTTAPAPVVATSPLSGDYVIDASHTRVGFSARHAMVTTVRGQFGEFEGTAHFDAANPAASTAQIVIQAASVDTGSTDRDGHLRSGDFFDVETYPEIRFVSTSAKLVDAETWALTGDLTIKDVTRPVTIEFEHTGRATDPFGNQRIGFEASAPTPAPAYHAGSGSVPVWTYVVPTTATRPKNTNTMTSPRAW